MSGIADVQRAAADIRLKVESRFGLFERDTDADGNCDRHPAGRKL